MSLMQLGAGVRGEGGDGGEENGEWTYSHERVCLLFPVGGVRIIRVDKMGYHLPLRKLVDPLVPGCESPRHKRAWLNGLAMFGDDRLIDSCWPG